MAAAQSMTELAGVFPMQAILLGMARQSRETIIAAFIHHLVELKELQSEDEGPVVQQILNRERMGSTALGNGIAIPNCLSAHTERFLGVLGILGEGIDFNAVDGEPVRCVFLVVGPPELREQHFDLLGRITAIGRDKSLRLQLLGCRSPEGIHHFLEELDRSAELAGRPARSRRFL
jgi:PTS system nitrogen regulatory IIA component